MKYFKSKFSIFILIQFQWKMLKMCTIFMKKMSYTIPMKKKNRICYWSRLRFLRFCCSFWKHLVRISDAFKLDIFREKLIPYKTRFLEGISYFHKMLQKRASKTRFFYFTIFWKLMKSQKFLIFISYTIPMEKFFLHFLRFCCPFLKYLVRISDTFKLDI